ncbi:MAG: AAA family ATPase [Myxococcales bacterium]|nr:AAA family ATPase [Myxococcales bacterium]
MATVLADWEEELSLTIRAGAPLLWLEAEEEPRALAALERACAATGRSMQRWSCVRGLHALRSSGVDGKTADPIAALDAFARSDGKALLVMLDAHPFLAQALVVRRLRELRAPLAAAGKTLVICAPVPCPVAELSGDCAKVLATPPTHGELQAVVAEVDRSAATAALAPRIAEAGRGLRSDAFSLALRRAIARFGAFDERAIGEVRRERDRAVSEGALLEPIEPDSGLDQIGGLDALKRWLDLRARAWTDDARSFGVDAPRGVFLVGVQGGGKSTCTRAIARRWSLPLLRLDVGRLFHGLVGASEANVRRALAQVESAAPCVLWLDELGRAFGDLSRGGDAGTSSRVFGALLTWLQDRTAHVFVVATSNDVSALPPELLRKGRFDEVFFVDLPARLERAEILSIHLSRRGRDASKFDLDELSARTEGFSGAELEQCVVAALLYAFSETRELDQRDLARAVSDTVSLSKTARESIDALRKWARGRTRPASTALDGATGRVAL